MCRLFGMRARTPVRATFWLLDAPDSLAAQSHREPDGAGIGVFDGAGHALVDKRPIAAWQDVQFATEARTLSSSTFVAHVRYASTGGLSRANTHPFEQDGRIFAHNGAFGGLEELDQRLAALGVADLVGGQTDSERMFALITGEIRAHGGDVQSGLVQALDWMVRTLPLYSLNLLLASTDELWALRYPDTNELYVLQRPAASRSGLDARSSRIHARSPALGDQDSVLLASERMDDDPGWRLIEPGELIRIGPDLEVQGSFPLPMTPSHQLNLADLTPHAAASQHPAPGAAG